MHSLCCDTDVADRNTAAAMPETTSTNNIPLAKFLDMRPKRSPPNSRSRATVNNIGEAEISGDEFHSARMNDIAETEKGSMIIGEESFRRINSSPTTSSKSNPRKPFGEIHLKVSSVGKVDPDDGGFY
ncbi:hypothetical protein HAX54_001926 [Datura stramonium]|uniref:Uncharacterized protein n=1 Tax=Datura stramonium TaxID=4076 RepID=A0ABS8T321_DATST|nr:hypothetical protein [Datura stramonium]